MPASVSGAHEPVLAPSSHFNSSHGSKGNHESIEDLMEGVSGLGGTAKFSRLFTEKQNIWQRFEEVDSDEVSSESEDGTDGDEYGQHMYFSECDRLGVPPSGSVTNDLGTSTVSAASYGLGVREVEPLIQALKHNRCVTRLDLSQNRLTCSVLFSIGELLGRSGTLSSLDLSGNALGRTPASPKALGALCPPPCRTLRTLCVSGCKLGDHDAAALFRALAAMAECRLERLDVSRNSISDKGAAALAKALGEKGVRCEVLVLAGNAIRDRGVSAVAGAVARNPGVSLEKLDVAETGMREGGAEALGALLRDAPALQRLVVSGNALSDAGLARLGEGVGVAPSLLALECDSVPMTDGAGRALLAQAKANKQLARLTLRGCGLGAEVEDAWRALTLRRGGNRPGD